MEELESFPDDVFSGESGCSEYDDIVNRVGVLGWVHRVRIQRNFWVRERDLWWEDRSGSGGCTEVSQEERRGVVAGCGGHEDEPVGGNQESVVAKESEAEAGEKSYTLYLMCDSYLGCDHEYSFSVDVKESGTGDHMEE